MPVSLLFYVHIKNYIKGRTTNERFSRKAQSSFSEAGDNEGGTTTYLDGKSDSESLLDSSRGSIVDEE
jgi:hypothetical protein